ncbi:MFS transporter, ACS family, solute carrier family 17, member 5 [Paragonimus westermani]|uniref:MFS transporter, ACS family, solute carrier family 17, member 5 n=1 Tax=Paragonimus westermani TaxID=34504 RepID=A0A5J4NHP1_9TREM|nr:MFS transporter, ACS family, solute carrier family 17, member 5 [Paragonimus westermani]
MVDETFDSHESGILKVTSFCGFTSGQKKLNSPPNMGRYKWNESHQSLILGAFFWGYILMQIPGGLLTLRYGPKRLGAVCIAGSALADLCVPIFAQYGYWCLIVLRIIQGLFQGAVMPIVGCLLGRWVPLDQRSRYTAFVYAGTQFGAVVGQAVAGELSQTRAVWNPMTQAPNYVNRWPNVHHLFGTLGLLFSGWWYYLVFDWPNVHPRITQAEMDGLKRRFDPTVFGCLRVYATLKAVLSISVRCACTLALYFPLASRMERVSVPRGLQLVLVHLGHVHADVHGTCIGL